MLNFLTIIIKNFQNLLKSRFVIGLAILGPLALVSLLSFGVIGTGLSNIDASFYSSEEGDFREVFLESLYKSSFLIVETNSKEECVNQVLNGKTNVCIILKEDPNGIPLPNRIGDRDIDNFKKSLGVEIQVDLSKQRVVWGIINRVQLVVDGFSEIIQQEIIDEISLKFESSLIQINTLESNIKYVGNQIDDNRKEIGDIKDNLNNFKTQSSSYLDVIQNNLNQIRVFLPPNNQQITQIDESLLNLKKLIDSTNSRSSSIALVEDSINQISVSLGLVKDKVAITKGNIISIKELLSDKGNFNLNKFIDPIPLSYSSITEETLSNSSDNLNLVDYILPSLISFFVVFSSLMFSSSLIIKERSSNAHIRNYLSKSSGVSFVLGNLIFLIITILFQVFILLLFAKFSINQSISENWFPLTLFIGLGVSIFSSLGMVLGYIFNTRDTVILSAVCISLIFIIFSPLVNPIETMPELLKEVFSKSPAVIVEQEVSRVLFFDSGIQGAYNILLLSIMFLILFVSSVILHNISKERLIKE